MNNKIITYTVNTIGKDVMKEQQRAIPKGFTMTYGGHQYISYCPVNYSRTHKILSNHYLKNHEISVYYDASITFKQDFTKEIALMKDYDIALLPHYAGRTISEELTVLKKMNYLYVEEIEEQINNYPEEIKHLPMYQGGLIIRKRNKKTAAFENTWFEEWKKHPYRDQISLLYAIKKHDMKVLMLDHNKIVVNPHKVDTLYDKEYYETHNNWKLKEYHHIAKAIKEHLSPDSVIDLGCGNGVLVSLLEKEGIKTFGVEASMDAINHRINKENTIYWHDLRVPIKKGLTTDLTVSIEVAEHIEPEMASNYCDNLTRFSDTVLMTASPEEDGGKYHFNPQNKEFWTQMMYTRGFERDMLVEQWIKEDLEERIMPNHAYLYENLMVFKREEL